MYEIIFIANGYEVIGIAEDGVQAINKYKTFKKKPDFIIMDYRMPIKDGLEATKEILEINRNEKIIFASADESIKDMVLTIGAIAFLKKPFPFVELFNVIEQHQ